MPRLTKGGRQSLTLIRDQLGAIRYYAQEARRLARSNPLVVEDAANDILRAIVDIEQEIAQTIEKLLERREARDAPDLTEKITHLADQVAQQKLRIERLEAQAEGRVITPVEKK